MAGIHNTIGNYHLLEELASGAFGRVYRGEHAILTTRIVAIKLMHGVHLNSQKERESFIQEALFLEKLKHPHILPIIDVGIHEGFPYLITEYASHGSLRQRLQRQPQVPLSEAEAITILSHIAQGLHHAHQKQVIHRDLKPENILFNAKNEALLADFGIATVMSTLSLQQATISGTPAYMAPEQFQGKVSQQSDQYALACIAYELFTGKQPFQAPDFISIGFKHLMEQPTPLRVLNPQLPQYIEQAILTAMAKDRANRHANLQVFLTALQAPISSPSPKKTPTRERRDQQAVPALQKTKVQWLTEGTSLYNLKRYEEALTAYEQAIRLDPNYTNAHYGKGISLNGLKRYEEALTAYDQAIRLDPNYAHAYYSKGNSLHNLKRYEEALTAFEQAIRLDPNYAFAYNNKGNSLRELKRYEEALTAYEQAIRLDPNDAVAYNNKGNSLYELKRYEEALTAYDQAIRLDPNYAHAYYNKGLALEQLGRQREAQQAYTRAKQLGYNN